LKINNIITYITSNINVIVEFCKQTPRNRIAHPLNQNKTRFHWLAPRAVRCRNWIWKSNRNSFNNARVLHAITLKSQFYFDEQYAYFRDREKKLYRPVLPLYSLLLLLLLLFSITPLQTHTHTYIRFVFLRHEWFITVALRTASDVARSPFFWTMSGDNTPSRHVVLLSLLLSSSSSS